jgi:cobalt-zinc-cadmium efflux system outer membrane protein
MTGRRMLVALAKLALAMLTACGPAAVAQQAAQALPERVTLPVLLRLVAERSPRLAAERIAIDAAEADRIVAGALPNPTLSYGRFRPSGGAQTIFEGSRQQQANVDFPLLIGGQRAARVEAAEQGVLGARARVAMAGNELVLRAAELFTGLQAAQEKIAVLAEALSEIERASSVISGRLDSGMASRYDLARVEIEVAGMAVRVQEARADEAEKSGGLAALLGAPGWRPRAEGLLTPSGLPSDASQWQDSLAARNPQIAAARREEDTARAALVRAEHERWPVPVLSLGRTWTSDPFGAANFVGFSTEVFLFDDRRGPVSKAQAELRAAERRREAVEAEVGVEMQRLLDALSQRRTALERFEQRVDVRTPALRQMAEDAYRLGRGTVLELIDATRSRVDARVTGIDLRAFTVQQELRILALTGGLGE